MNNKNNKKLEYRALGYITEEDTPGVISGVAMIYGKEAPATEKKYSCREHFKAQKKLS